MRRRLLLRLLALALAPTLAACAPAPRIPDLPRPAAEPTSSATASSTAGGLASRLPASPAYEDAHPDPYSWAHGRVLVAHAMGAVEGKRNTESLEAFQAAYARGCRVFEADLVPARDGKLVARLGWDAYMYDMLGQKVTNPYARLTSSEFAKLKIHGRFTPLTLDDLMTLLRAYPDAWLMIDVREKTDAEVAAAMDAVVRAMGPDTQLRERIIVQIHRTSELKTVRSAHRFRNVVLVPYGLTGKARDDAIDFAASNDVLVVALTETEWTPELAARVTGHGLVAAVYTVNDRGQAARMAASGVTVLYSDDLAPADLSR